MKVESMAAWVLHKWPMGNTSLQITFFTREFGIIQCLCKGGRNPQKQALLQAFVPLWLALNWRKDRYYIHHIEATAAILELKAATLFAGLYLNELTYYSLRAGDPYPELFQAYQKGLRNLVYVKDKQTLEVLLRQFEWVLLSACGYSVSFTEDARLGTPIDIASSYQFIADEGFISAPAGLAGGDILALARGELVDAEVLKTAKLVMRQAIDRLLGGRQLKSRSLYRS